MTDTRPLTLRHQVDAGMYAAPEGVLQTLLATAALPAEDRATISRQAADLVRAIRGTTQPGLMEVFLAEYGLSTDEGVALMCLAEALLRVPDADTIDALIEDKIAPSDWGRHMGHSTSSLVNASTWALMLTGRVLDDEQPGPVRHLRAAVKRLGEPVIRTAVSRAMKEMGRQFVLGEDITAAMKRAAGMEKKGFTYSYDMLGEAARTEGDAKRYHLSYSRAISAIATACTEADIRKNPGISVKLSALHPRYEVAQEEAVMTDLVPRLRALCLLAKSAGMGLNVDAEEADRLALSLDVIDRVMSEPALKGWDGFGIVVQAFGPRAATVIDALYDMAQRHDRKIMVRLVKGAYWDTEIKRAQVEGIDGFPVFTQKAATDVSYISNARKLLGMTDRIYPQFATHNAHTVAAVLHMGAGQKDAFEFQRLHGMGETLHTLVMQDHGSRCRIYAPVGAHKDLLAYLVRRLLENGANSSFVNQIVDENVPPEVVAADPFAQLGQPTNLSIAKGPEVFAPLRANARGFDLTHTQTLDEINTARDPFKDHQWHAAPLLAGKAQPQEAVAVLNPADHATSPGSVRNASPADVATALENAAPWDAPLAERRAVLLKAADLIEDNYGEIFALLAREAGKGLPDCVAELREGVDFLRYYAGQATGEPPAGIFTCISPWNFPMAIFAGQISAALAAGNAVLAKPAEQTPLVAFVTVSLLHKAGVPHTALQLLPGGGDIGAALTGDARINGVAFTGSTATAQRIRTNMAAHCAPGTPLIAETGGLNAMIVDSTALPEQAVQAIVESAFQSAGQRCSALRCLYVQEDIAEDLQKMLIGAMEALQMGDPWELRTDVGPVIDTLARSGIQDHIEAARTNGRLVAELQRPQNGTYVAPTILRVQGIKDMKREIFGPVLHIATFKSHELDAVIDAINATGYGLTFGLHTRIDDRVQYVSERIEAGNIYINRNQIGAIVGSQPFGGEGLSGTGPKAGGPNYLPRFGAPDLQQVSDTWDKAQAKLPDLPAHTGVTAPIETLSMPGPTGESNRLSTLPRAPLLCMGPGVEATQAQARAVEALGGNALRASGQIDPAALATGPEYGGVLWWGDAQTGREIETALAKRGGAILPLIPGLPDPARVRAERHVCVDTTASGGNAALLGAAS
ncbi:bifunctional proline dehydrogenase/L-glutamate gamma-semialdehyde dehydrogenase PutA [Sulfitobacter sp. M57]|uniref:bifunctional proline dehydrogenase/L-glutamate gamma-semialdehyde dehydrogenase PutA n=1 Tax=unclassified Sulfitobacter TaxID=196795 RepID=UPI0023E29E9F|nr:MULTISPECIES: bifunctional proline dehydrogenase/L-glutamate gamma-semialdehyde dehydrogenase PutA [unclassified Sulfitobacter]MDF3413064.1 bifunctional proline dehydrogenase/L-glutamate gamma-semialdehyde dehydrogenase PutA [Sulfitobacter sp. KE5]MDF3421652.1 bifunctional proline dehydrogenase/L-glutamate gamma-semialdehyde dehydrogenase PutA [Sulfitobacter sp. KE43]MDF3431613.1 bifunctional proline dehydrogenase/L-glutamate gamma-semialdehyde dehydrogenase PutA [Sulfitobacter sp. KE42]MDF3